MSRYSRDIFSDGLCFSAVAAFSCDFLNKVEDHDFLGYSMGTTWYGIGFLGTSVHGYYGDSNVCHGWTQYEKDRLWDSSWVAGWSFALIAFSFGVLAMVASFLFCCVADTNKLYCCMICVYLFIAMCQGLSFIALSSDLIDTLDWEQGSDYHIGVGAGCSIVATIIWALCALLAGRSIDRDQMEDTGEPVVASEVVDPQNEEAIVTTTVTKMEDGSTVTETVKTFPDGSKDITTTTESPV
eukprot:CAMPEP_0185735626 /NCGR_PEP_ID=MMETSP1171-20130828/25793_1 /TAXON_ID=374046 /ORGANISM="Helicotheca tamensis, Strain CCMP826" /LENGTH=239 /DNA_ID=CAMNT_0028406007 /DNA_START=176 /DNA_END=896 /DNA_ORIENTATION=-